MTATGLSTAKHKNPTAVAVAVFLTCLMLWAPTADAQAPMAQSQSNESAPLLRNLARCKSQLGYAPKNGGFSLIILNLRVHGITCKRGLKIGGASIAGDPMPAGWNCESSSTPWTDCRFKQSNHRFRFIFGGDAG